MDEIAAKICPLSNESRVLARNRDFIQIAEYLKWHDRRVKSFWTASVPCNFADLTTPLHSAGHFHFDDTFRDKQK